MTKSKQRSSMTDENLQDSLKPALTQYSPDFQQMVNEMQAQTNKQGKSVLSTYVAFTTNLSFVI
jgi:signal transduction protein with GAF and PtsI domain